jgi:thiol-disulfide isomerase/thioredoxin
MAVNRRVLFASLGVAVIISIGGGYALSRTSGSNSAADDNVAISSNSTFGEPGIPVNSAVQGKKLPTVNLIGIDGAKVSTASLIGKALVLNIWATTCEACKKEMPALAQMNAEFADSVRFIGVNQFENNDTALRFAQDKGVLYELLSDQNGELVRALGVAGLPYTLFVSADGTIVAQKGIALDVDKLRIAINNTLATP